MTAANWGMHEGGGKRRWWTSHRSRGRSGRLIATAQNGLEVIRYGGLETGSVPSPFQIVESTPMYRLRRYFPPDNRNGQTPSGRLC